MIRLMAFPSCLALALFGFGHHAFAWNKPGHMVTGAIAYQDLKANHPQVIPRVLAIFNQHPDYATRWQPKLTNAPDPDLVLSFYNLIKYVFAHIANVRKGARRPDFDYATTVRILSAKVKVR